jgi:hypothetical protein
MAGSLVLRCGSGAHLTLFPPVESVAPHFNHQTTICWGWWRQVNTPTQVNPAS